MVRALVALVGCLILLAIVALGAEIWTRKAIDERVQQTVEDYLTSASSDGLGFDTVVARHLGWALPDLYRGNLERIDAVAVEGELAGLPVQRLTLSAGPVDLAGRQAGSVQATATLGPQAVASVVASSGGLSGAAVTMLTADTIRVTAPAQGMELVVDLRVAAEGGGVVATAVSATAGGVALDPATVVPQPLPLLPVSSLPAGLLATGVEVSSGPGGVGAAVELRFGCTDCRLG